MTYAGVTCCFCGKNVKISKSDPCDISIAANWDKREKEAKGQFFWCHMQCFEEKMDPSVRIHFFLPCLSGGDDDDDETEAGA